MIDEAVIIFLAAFPTLLDIVVVLSCLIKFLRSFKGLREDLKKKVEMEELKEKLEVSISQARELEKKLNEVLEEYTKIKKQ